MKNIIITGGYGQLGIACKKDLKNSFNTLITGSNTFREGVKLDITNRNDIARVYSDFKPDVVLNLAAMTNVDECDRDKIGANKINIEGVENLCENFKGHFIQLSTDYVFDGLSGPYNELDEVNPISHYGKTKLEAENWLKNNYSNSTILRANVLYSYTKRTKASFVKWVVDSLKNNKEINVVNDQWNNPTWTESISFVIKNIINIGLTGLYNYGDKDFMCRYDFAILISKIFNLDETLIKPIKTSNLNQVAKRPLKSGLKTEKIESRLGIVPNSVEDCLRKISNNLTK
ncbi:MAG: SDR family oxidoreductase [Fidelibacterota bacterium]|jgi:dTDP-4-dehydrorhamnose reductase|tara:strand:+ start:6989 stop:7852 length:864 start_codon:yes stop_codon:yes gene_type:complete